MWGDPIQPMLFTLFSPTSCLDVNGNGSCPCPGSAITKALYSATARGQNLPHLLPHSHSAPPASPCPLCTSPSFTGALLLFHLFCCWSETHPWPAQSPLLVAASRSIRDGGRLGHGQVKCTRRWAVRQGPYHSGKTVSGKPSLMLS